MNLILLILSWVTSDKAKSVAAIAGTIGTAVLGHYSYSQQTQLENLGLKKTQLLREITTLETTLGDAKARLANLQKEKDLADSMYLELKSRYSAIDNKLVASKLTITKLRSVKGSPDDAILELKITDNIATVANGGVLPSPK